MGRVPILNRSLQSVGCDAVIDQASLYAFLEPGVEPALQNSVMGSLGSWGVPLVTSSCSYQKKGAYVLGRQRPAKERRDKAGRGSEELLT